MCKFLSSTVQEGYKLSFKTGRSNTMRRGEERRDKKGKDIGRMTDRSQ